MNEQYIAGLFDGEGCIGLYTQNDSHFSPRIQLCQNKSKEYSKIVEFLKQKYGGYVFEQRTSSGRINVKWCLSNRKISIVFLRDIEPYLILKKKQCSMLINWIQSCPDIKRNNLGRILSTPTKFVNESKKISIELKKLKKPQMAVVKG